MSTAAHERPPAGHPVPSVLVEVTTGAYTVSTTGHHPTRGAKRGRAGVRRDPFELLDERQVSAMLQVSMRTLRRWRRAGYGPPVTKISRFVRYRRGDVETWIIAQREQGRRS